MDGFHFNIPGDRVLTGVWDGKPITRPKEPYEKFCEAQKMDGGHVPSIEEFDLWLKLLGSAGYKPKYNGKL